jgi:hypothetical protein
MISAWEKLDIPEGLAVEAEWVIRIGGRRYVTRRDLTRLWDLADGSLTRYIQKGLPVSPLSKEKFQVFDYVEVVAWRNENIDLAAGRNAKSNRTTSEDHNDLDSENPKMSTEKEKASSLTMRQMVADTKRSEENALIAELKRKEAEKSLIPSSAAEEALAEQAVIHASNYAQDKKLLPVQIENLPRHDIRAFLDQHYAGRMSDLKSLISKQFECDETLYDIVSTTLEALKNGATPKSIVKAIECFYES